MLIRPSNLNSNWGLSMSVNQEVFAKQLDLHLLCAKRDTDFGYSFKKFDSQPLHFSYYDTISKNASIERASVKVVLPCFRGMFHSVSVPQGTLTLPLAGSFKVLCLVKTSSLAHYYVTFQTYIHLLNGLLQKVILHYHTCLRIHCYFKRDFL